MKRPAIELYPTISVAEMCGTLGITISAHAIHRCPEKVTVEYFAGECYCILCLNYSDVINFKLLAPTGVVTVKFWTRAEPILFATPKIIRLVYLPI